MKKGWPCKLSPQIVIQMKAEYLSGMTFEAIAARHGVTRRTASRAVRGENWKRVGSPVTVNMYRQTG